MPNIDISRRIMTLLRERLYEPKISRGANGAWLITFFYTSEEGDQMEWVIQNNSLIADQWWLK